MTRKPTGLLTALLEIALSFGLYYLLRAFGVGVFWALTVPAIVVAGIAVTVTVRRRHVDMIGLLVLFEVLVTIVLSLATQSPRIAAIREPAYTLIGGVFCLVTLFYREPLTHVTAASVATFGDPKREEAFKHAWQDVPAYRMWQRLITAVIGGIMVGSALIRAYILASTETDQIAHAVDVSNTILFVMLGVLVVVSAILIQRPKKIIEELANNRDPEGPTRSAPASSQGRDGS